MQIKIFYFSGCPNWETAVARVQTVLAEVGRADTVVQAEDVQQMSHLPSEWAGSPTLLVDGRDPFAVADEPPPVWKGRRLNEPHVVTARDVCRVYVTEAGFDGAPSIDQLRTALRHNTRS